MYLNCLELWYTIRTYCGTITYEVGANMITIHRAMDSVLHLKSQLIVTPTE